MFSELTVKVLFVVANHHGARQLTFNASFAAIANATLVQVRSIRLPQVLLNC